MFLKRRHIAFVGYLFLLPACAFLIDSTTTVEVFRNGQIVNTTPLEESEWRGTHAPYAQNVGRVWQLTKDGTGFGHTATLIAPDLILTSGHSARTDHVRNFDRFVFNITIGEKLYARNIEKTHICPLNTFAGEQITNSAKDLAILKLTEEIPQSTFPSFYNQSVQSLFRDKDSSFDCLSVSTGRLVTNGAPKQFRLCRHVSESRITWDSKSCYFIEDCYIPMGYRSSQVVPHINNKLELPIFDYNYPNKPFLQGVMVRGDSGGPLISRIGKSDQIIGVISTRSIISAYNSYTSKFVPGGQLLNIWTPTVSNLPWIKQILTQESALDYHPNLKKDDE